MERFEIAGGSIVGRNHRKIGRNNQDAYIFQNTADSIIGVVADGCGSAKYSEIGARILSQIALKTLSGYLPLLKRCVDEKESALIFWDLARNRMLEKLAKIVEAMGVKAKSAIGDYLLATLVGFIITARKTFIFSLGDGEAYANGHLIKFGSFPNNAPPYLAYALLSEKLTPFDDCFLSFSIDLEIDTEKLDTLLIGTDGITELRQKAEECIPGKTEKVGPISAWWENDIFFRNPDAVRRKLYLINSDAVKIKYGEKGEMKEVNRVRGLLEDDTSLIVVRRKRGGEDNESNRQ